MDFIDHRQNIEKFRNDKRCKSDGLEIDERLVEERHGSYKDHHGLIDTNPSVDQELFECQLSAFLNGFIELRVLEQLLFRDIVVKHDRENRQERK